MPIDVTQGLPDGVTASFVPVTPSTMQAAADYSGPMPHWILAGQQTHARGRRGRSWLPAEGSFAATLILSPKCTPQLAACRSFVAACALRVALEQCLPRDGTTRQLPTLQHKWPNDVLLNGGKVAGILLEAQGSTGGGVDRLHIGIGVNLGHAPPDVPDAAFAPIGIADIIGTAVDKVTFLRTLAAAFSHHENQIQNYGFGPIRQTWLRHAARLGETIIARTGHDVIEGTFKGIDDTGNLLLLTNQGRAVIPAADVYF